MFGRVLVANRGEIAVRIIRALREMNIRSIAVFSDADRGALHVRLADEAEHIGPAPSAESYLRVDRILEAAKKHRAEAIHPGYGFLSENAGFAAACARSRYRLHRTVGRGDPASGIENRRAHSGEAGRRTGGSRQRRAGHRTSSMRARWRARSAIRCCSKRPRAAAARACGASTQESELESAIRDAASEAERAFQNGEVYIEKMIEKPRHIEIQIAGDHYGNLVHLGERECSLQRRHQKIIEECPSPFVARHPELRAAMGEAALKIARAAGYDNLGTVEFLADHRGNFYFLEVNTRLQVEHPVTELVTG